VSYIFYLTRNRQHNTHRSLPWHINCRTRIKEREYPKFQKFKRLEMQHSMKEAHKGQHNLIEHCLPCVKFAITKHTKTNLRNHTMKGAPLITKALFASAKSPEIFSTLWGNIGTEFKRNASHRISTNFHVKIHCSIHETMNEWHDCVRGRLYSMGTFPLRLRTRIRKANNLSPLGLPAIMEMLERE